jgi:hypothetical protein
VLTSYQFNPGANCQVCSDDFLSGTKGWRVFHLSTGSEFSVGTSSCNEYGTVLGGLGLLNADKAVKTYRLGYHTSVRIKLGFLVIDNWNGDTAYMMVDGKTVWARQVQPYEGQGGCGNSWYPELLLNVDITVEHMASTLTLTVAASIVGPGNEGESWGIQYVSVQAIANCNLCKTVSFQQGTGQTICDECGPGNFSQLSYFQDDFGPGTQISGWSVTDSFSGLAVTPTTFNCNEYFDLMGAFRIGTEAQKIYQLSGHSWVRIKLGFLVVDNWNGDLATMQVDGSTVWNRWVSPYEGSGGCLEGWYPELLLTVDITVPHTSSTLTLTIKAVQSGGGFAGEYWGISYVSVQAISECIMCPAGTFQNLTGQLNCDLCPAGTNSASGPDYNQTPPI